MERKAAGENARARSGMRNQAFSSPPTPRFAHTGEKNRGKLEPEKTPNEAKADIIEYHSPEYPFHESGEIFGL